MMAKRILAITATVLASLAMARLVDAVGKRALMGVAQELDEQVAAVGNEHHQLEAQRDQLELDQALLGHRIAAMSKREHHLVILRGRQRLQLALGDKVMLEIGYQLRGPVEDVRSFAAMPRSTLEVLGKRENTNWYRPDWLYRLEGLEPPVDSGVRLVKDAFGPGEVFLGAGISIQGERHIDVPAEAVDHTYIEVDDESLKAVVEAVDKGTLVFIQ
jgi:hypothetical protein